MNVAPMTYTDFLATATPCANLNALMDYAVEDENGQPIIDCGVVYADRAAYITAQVDGFTFHVGNVGRFDADVNALAPLAYAYALAECPEKLGVPDDVHAFICALQSEIGDDNFAAAMLANADESDAGVCHFHDYCDANQIALDAAASCYGSRDPQDAGDYDDIEKASAIYDAARPFLRGGAA